LGNPTGMIKDDELKQNKVFWIEIKDKELGKLFGVQLPMRWTGLCFRSLEYDINKIKKRHEDK
jgi:hypothetical protein